MQPWILASASPQRSRILRDLGVSFEVIPSAYNESDHPERDPAKRALALGEMKAKDVAANHPGRFVIGCDTLVVAPDGTLLEKPKDEHEARTMLALQSGGVSLVHSGLAIVAPDGSVLSDISTSHVRFRALNQKDIDWWMSTNLWQDRSGSFQIDGPGQLMIEQLDGDFSSVVGFPIYLFGQLAAKAGNPVTES